jgi:hypothetical protein
MSIRRNGSNMLKKLALALAVLVSLFGAIQVGAPVAAQAATPTVQSVLANETPALDQVQTHAPASLHSPAGYLTFWSGCGSPAVGFCGAAWAFNTGGGLNVCHAVPTGANDQFAAFSNNSGSNFRVWTAAGCTGSSATLFNGTETGQLASPFYKSITSTQRIS